MALTSVTANQPLDVHVFLDSSDEGWSVIHQQVPLERDGYGRIQTPPTMEPTSLIAWDAQSQQLGRVQWHTPNHSWPSFVTRIQPHTQASASMHEPPLIRLELEGKEKDTSSIIGRWLSFHDSNQTDMWILPSPSSAVAANANGEWELICVPRSRVLTIRFLIQQAPDHLPWQQSPLAKSANVLIAAADQSDEKQQQWQTARAIQSGLRNRLTVAYVMNGWKTTTYHHIVVEEDASRLLSWKQMVSLHNQTHHAWDNIRVIVHVGTHIRFATIEGRRQAMERFTAVPKYAMRAQASTYESLTSSVRAAAPSPHTMPKDADEADVASLDGHTQYVLPDILHDVELGSRRQFALGSKPMNDRDWMCRTVYRATWNCWLHVRRIPTTNGGVVDNTDEKERAVDTSSHARSARTSRTRPRAGAEPMRTLRVDWDDIKGHQIQTAQYLRMTPRAWTQYKQSVRRVLQEQATAQASPLTLHRLVSGPVFIYARRHELATLATDEHDVLQLIGQFDVTAEQANQPLATHEWCLHPQSKVQLVVDRVVQFTKRDVRAVAVLRKVVDATAVSAIHRRDSTTTTDMGAVPSTDYHVTDRHQLLISGHVLVPATDRNMGRHGRVELTIPWWSMQNVGARLILPEVMTDDHWMNNVDHYSASRDDEKAWKWCVCQDPTQQAMHITFVPQLPRSTAQQESTSAAARKLVHSVPLHFVISGDAAFVTSVSS